MWTRLNWFLIGFKGGFCEQGIQTPGSSKEEFCEELNVVLMADSKYSKHANKQNRHNFAAAISVFIVRFLHTRHKIIRLYNLMR
jgi:hypothetical protein